MWHPHADRPPLQLSISVWHSTGVYEDACKGGKSGSDQAECVDGATGVLCGICLDDHVLQSDGSCSRCDTGSEKTYNIVAIAVLAALICLVVLCCAWSSKRAEAAEDDQTRDTVLDVSAVQERAAQEVLT